MKRIFALLIIALFSVPLLKAQEPTFSMGDKVVNLGIGLGSTWYGGLYYSTGVPPISISYEQALIDDVLEEGVIGIGGSVIYSSYRYRYTVLGSDWGWNYSNIILGGLGTFHYPLVDNLDTYFGLLLGFRISIDREYGTVPGESVSDASSGIAYYGFVGGRYYFSEKFAAFAQLGYGISWLTLGVSIKL